MIENDARAAWNTTTASDAELIDILKSAQHLTVANGDADFKASFVSPRRQGALVDRQFYLTLKAGDTILYLQCPWKKEDDQLKMGDFGRLSLCKEFNTSVWVKIEEGSIESFTHIINSASETTHHKILLPNLAVREEDTKEECFTPKRRKTAATLKIPAAPAPVPVPVPVVAPARRVQKPKESSDVSAATIRQMALKLEEKDGVRYDPQMAPQGTIFNTINNSTEIKNPKARRGSNHCNTAAIQNGERVLQIFYHIHGLEGEPKSIEQGSLLLLKENNRYCIFRVGANNELLKENEAPANLSERWSNDGCRQQYSYTESVAEFNINPLGEITSIEFY